MNDKELKDTGVLDYPIPVLSNQMIVKFMNDGLISIDPYDSQRLGLAEYQLMPCRVRYNRYDENGQSEQDSVLIEEDKPYLLQPRESVVISIKEEIILEKGVIAEFYPSSYCIENKLILSGGRLHAGYDLALVLTLENTNNEMIKLYPSTQIARVSFGWLGANNFPDYECATAPGTYLGEDMKLYRKKESKFT